jgi:hypothetical protein
MDAVELPQVAGGSILKPAGRKEIDLGQDEASLSAIPAKRPLAGGSLRIEMTANNEVVMKEMERRGPLEL